MVGVLIPQKLANIKIRVSGPHPLREPVVQHIPARPWPIQTWMTPLGPLHLKCPFKTVLLWAKLTVPLYPPLWMRAALGRACPWARQFSAGGTVPEETDNWRMSTDTFTIWNKNPPFMWTLRGISLCAPQPLLPEDSNIIDLGQARTLGYVYCSLDNPYMQSHSILFKSQACWDDSVFCLFICFAFINVYILLPFNEIVPGAKACVQPAIDNYF